MAKEEYPFSGVDMLQNSMSQLISELRNVGSALSQSARSLNSAGLQHASYISGSLNTMHMSAMAGASRITAPIEGGTNMFRETFSRQFNKPSLWSRDIIGALGIRDYDDMSQGEVQRYARHNLGRRAEMLGVNALQAGNTAWGVASMFGKVAMGPIGTAASFAADYTLGEWLKNIQQKGDWWSYLDRVGRSNALLGKGGGEFGWSDQGLKDMSKWLSTQDKTWYQRGLGMNYKDIQSTVQSAEMQGYFFNTANPDEFKQKLTKLISDTKEIMKTMKMANDEAAALIGEMSYFGYKSPNMTIKQMNRTAAMTGLSFDEVKNYGIEYARSNYSAFSTSKDVSTDLILTAMQKYDKKTMSGLQGEASGITSATTNPSNWLLSTRYNSATGRMELDEKRMMEAAGMDPMQSSAIIASRMREMSSAVGGDASKMAALMMQLQASGPTMMQSASPEVVQLFSLGRNMSNLKETMLRLDNGGSIQGAINRGGNDPTAWLTYLNEQDMRTVAHHYARSQNIPMEQAMNILKTYGTGVPVGDRGPMTLDDITSPIKKRKLLGFLSWGMGYDYGDGYRPGGETESVSWRDALTGRGPKRYGFEQGAMTDPITQLLYMSLATDKKWRRQFTDTEDRLKEVTGIGEWDHALHNKDWNMIMAMATRGSRYQDFHANKQVRMQYRDYWAGRGYTMEQSATAADSEYSADVVRRALAGDSSIDDADTYGKWRSRASEFTRRGGTIWGKEVEEYANRDRSGKKTLDLFAIRATLATRESARYFLEKAEETGNFDPNTWSPTLANEAAYIHAIDPSNRTSWQQGIVDAGDYNWSRALRNQDRGLVNKMNRAYSKAIRATSLRNLQRYAGEFIDLAKKGGIDDASMWGAKLSEIGAKQVMGLGVPELHLQGRALSALANEGTVMGSVYGSQYSDILSGGMVTSIMTQMSDPMSPYSWYTKSKDGREKLLTTMMNAASREANRAGKPFSEADRRNVRGILSGVIESDSETQKKITMTNLAQQNTVLAETQRTNLSLSNIDNKMGLLSQSVDGRMLRVITYGERRGRRVNQTLAREGSSE